MAKTVKLDERWLPKKAPKIKFKEDLGLPKKNISRYDMLQQTAAAAPNFIENPYEVPEKAEVLFSEDMRTELREQLYLLVKRLMKVFEVVSISSLSSIREVLVDPTGYTGTAGILFAMLKYRRYMHKLNGGKFPKPDWLTESLQSALMTNFGSIERNIEEDERVMKSESVAFYTSSHVGITLTTALFYLQLAPDIDWIGVAHMTRQLTEWQDVWDEVSLYNGAGGYLWALLVLAGKLREVDGPMIECTADLLETLYGAIIHTVVKIKLKQQMSKEEHKFRVFELQRKGDLNSTSISQLKRRPLVTFTQGEEELGAGSGPAGLVYMFIKAVEMVPKLKKDEELITLIKMSVEKLMDAVLPSGVLPTELSKPKEYRVDFCKGSPGLIPLFTAAAALFPSLQQSLLEKAESIGQLIWKEGLLRKGNGLCHGIAGNGYFLHTLYRKFSELKQTKKALEWKSKAYLFAFALFDRQIQDVADEYRGEPGKKERHIYGIPDYPYSLMEGAAGEISFVSDLLTGEVRFPGYEV